MSPVQIPQVETVASFDGAAIAYRDFGGSGPALVLLPGWACIQTMWDGAIPFLAQHGRVVSLDFAGFGSSTAGTREWTMADFARDTRAVIEHLDLREVTLIGHSMGAAVALETASLCPDRIVGVIGCDSLTYSEVYQKVDEAIIAAALPAYRENFATTVRTMIGAYLLKSGDAGLATYVSDVMAAAQPDCAIPAIEQLLRWDLDDNLGRCRVPVSVINARLFMKAEAEARYRDRISIRTIDNVGHFLMLEQPQAFADAVAAVLAGTEPSPPPALAPSR